MGYKNLEQLREALRPFLLRRTRASVMQQLPERTTEIVRIRPNKKSGPFGSSPSRAIERLPNGPQKIQTILKVVCRSSYTTKSVSRPGVGTQYRPFSSG
ncbi:SNF2-related protein [Pirellulaceae bacterium SH449]